MVALFEERMWSVLDAGTSLEVLEVEGGGRGGAGGAAVLF